ncbi:hypothetical protein Sjap_017619 [Stephania japonica]|uniref:Uncharacterized protein n=1 Tax=Stephania japonica TaxID=461633 RepID=A0AAP0I6H1_9MAGN
MIPPVGAPTGPSPGLLSASYSSREKISKGCRIQCLHRLRRLKKKKRNLKQEVSPSFQQPERSTSDSLPDSATYGNDYRVLRRKYLLLEEENCAVGRVLEGIEDNVKVLENEKLALLDELVVLEGLVDPSELQLQRP